MVTHTQKLTRQGSIAMLPAITTLARKLLKQTWGLLSVILCGMIVCVGLVCAIPLFTQVALQTGLQRVLQQEPGGRTITEYVQSDYPTASQIKQIGQNMDQAVQSHLTTYLDGPTQFSLQTPMLQLLDTKTGAALAGQYVNIFGYDPSQMAQQVSIQQGRLPQTAATANEIEIALTQPVADALHLQVGSTQQVRYPVAAGSVVWNLHVVGIVAIRSSSSNIWHSQNITNDNKDGVDIQNRTNDILASQAAILPEIAKIHVTPLNNTNGIGNATDPDPQFFLYWTYPIAIARIDANNINNILQQYASLSASQNNVTSSQDPHIQIESLQSTMMEELGNYEHEIPFTLAAIVLLLVSILALALFTVSLLASILVERQAATISILRSRGAVQRHILGAFTLQGLLLGLIALLAGPVFAVFLVGCIGQFVIPTTTQSIFVAVINDLPDTSKEMWIGALLTIMVTLTVMIITLRNASHIDIVTLRRNTARINQTPLWKRIYLDFILTIIIAVGIAYYQFIFTSGVGDRISLAPLAFLGAPAILLTISLLFLRFFPVLTHIGTRLIAKNKGASGILALAQMERQPRATLRMILLIALGLASSIYLLSFITTQQYRIQQVADYQIGADFSGPLTTTGSQQTFKQLQEHYSSLPGITSATLGNHSIIETDPQSNLPETIINAVNADTYAQTAVWSSSYTNQSLQSLMEQLVNRRTAAIAANQVYAITDTQMWKALNLSPGTSFTLPTQDPHAQNIHFIALAEANNLPVGQISLGGYMDASMLVDYQNYTSVYTKSHPGTQIEPDYLWLSTKDDAHSLAQVRQAFPNLQDRRAIIEQARTEPLQIAIEGTLILGLITAFTLILIGTTLTAWINVKQRLTSFSILRALGMTPGQIAGILLWEQGITYSFALLIALIIGWISTLVIVPAFGLLDYILQAVGVTFDNIQIPLDKSAPIPNMWIGQMLIIFIGICVLLLLLTCRYVMQPKISQTLRLNED